MTIVEAQTPEAATREPDPRPKADDQAPWTLLFSVSLAALGVRTLMLLGVLAPGSAVLSVLWAAILFVAAFASLRFAATRDDIGSRHVSDTLVLAVTVGAFAWMFPNYAPGFFVETVGQRLGVALTGAGAGGLVGAMILVASTRARATVATSACVASTVLLLATALLFQAEGFTTGLIIAIGAEAFALFGRNEPPGDEPLPAPGTLRSPRSFVSLLTAIVALLGVQQAFSKNIWSDNLPAIIVLGVMFAAALVSVTDVTRQLQNESTEQDMAPSTGEAVSLGSSFGGAGGPVPVGSAAGVVGGAGGAVSPGSSFGGAVSPGSSLGGAGAASMGSSPGGAGAASMGPSFGGAGGPVPVGSAAGGVGGPIAAGRGPEQGLRIDTVASGSGTSTSGQIFGMGDENRRPMTITGDEQLQTPRHSADQPGRRPDRSLADLAEKGIPIATSWLDSDEQAAVPTSGDPKPTATSSDSWIASVTATATGGIFGAAVEEILVRDPRSGSQPDVPEVQWGRAQSTTTIDVDDATPPGREPDQTTEPQSSPESAMPTTTAAPDETDPFLARPGSFMAIPRTDNARDLLGAMGSSSDSVAEGLANYKAATAWTHNGIMLGGNAEFWSLIERSPVADFQLLSVVHPQDRPLLAQAISRGTRTGASNRMTLRFVPNPSRGAIWVRAVGGTYQSDVGPLGEVPNASWQLSFAPTDPETDPEEKARHESYDLETGLLDERYLQYWLDHHEKDSKRSEDRPLLLVIEASDPRRFDSAPLRERRSVMSEMSGALLEATRAKDTIVRLPGPYLVIIAESIPDGGEWPVMSRFVPLTDTPLSELQELLTELPPHASRVVPMRVQSGTAVSDIQAMMAQTLDA